MKGKKMKVRIIFLLLVAVIFVLIAAQCSSSAPTSAPTSAPQSPANTQSSSSQLDGQALTQSQCSLCHTLQRATNFSGNAAQWKTVVDNMIRRGAPLTMDQETAIVNYLAQTYP